MHGNNKIPLVKQYQINKEKESLDTSDIHKRKSLYGRIARTFSNIFEISVELGDNYEGKEDKKAWIDTSAEKTKIVLNLGNKSTNEADFIHEYLHLFFFALKYNDGGRNYEALMNQYKKDNGLNTINWSEIEEDLVTKASLFMSGNAESPILDFETFYAALNQALSNMHLSEVVLGTNIYDILNKEMKEIFPSVKNNAFSNAGVILFEANFRN